jgi:hypothetical protein
MGQEKVPQGREQSSVPGREKVATYCKALDQGTSVILSIIYIILYHFLENCPEIFKMAWVNYLYTKRDR